ncbi:MAG: phage virion morphogenesis protein [Moorea sp. SIO3C2]|nr:phage virion morphogenesis protein [Moorena sp. SIO3C2]
MDLQVDIDLSQWNRVKAKIGKTDLSAPMREVANYMDAQTRQRFIKEVDPDGKSWAPLAPSTISQKRSGVILRETGLLVNSFRSSSNHDTATLSNPVFYGVFLQFGTQKILARPFLGISGQDVDNIERIIIDYLL